MKITKDILNDCLIKLEMCNIISESEVEVSFEKVRKWNGYNAMGTIPMQVYIDDDFRENYLRQTK